MALTDAQWAEQVAAVVADLVTETITEAQASALIAAATEDWPTRTLSNADLAARVSRFLARLNGLILTNGAPDVALGELNTFAYDTVNGALYGPKTASGWGTPVSLVGPPGAQGAPGPKGDQGDQGTVGPKGDTGDVGVQGPKGDTGDTGPKGDTGDTGATGPKGDKGDRGDAFAVNAQGDLAGRAAFDAEAVGFSYLDVENGNLYFRVAPSGWSGAIPFGKGEQGDPGEPGPKGDTGDEGPQGPPGADGVDGSDASVTEAAVLDALGFTPENGAQKGAANGYAELAADSKVPAGQLAFATKEDIWAGTVDGKIIPPKVMTEALAQVAVTEASAIAGLDFATFINPTFLLTANRTLGAPVNATPGKSGALFVSNNGFTLAWNAAYRLPVGGIALQPVGLTCIPYLIGASGAVLLFPPTKWVAA